MQGCFAHADDIIILHTQSDQFSLATLQQQINSVADFATENAQVLNRSKCKGVMVSSFKPTAL